MNLQLDGRRGTVSRLTKINLLACLLLLAGGLGACKPESTAARGPDLSGTYTLMTVNGSKVPAAVTHDGAKIEVRSGTFSFSADGTCSTTTVFVPPSGTEAKRVVNATYTRDGSKLTMRWQGAGTTTGSVASNIFTMNNEGMVLVYQK